MNCRTLLIFVAGTLACLSQLPAAPLKTAQLLAAGKEQVRIVCIGDSITGVYYHSGGLRAYPEMLEIALKQIHPQALVSVRNAGISGDTTAGGLRRLERDVLAHRPHLVTVMFGMNDLVGTQAVAFEKHLREIILRCRGIGAEVVLCTQNSIYPSEKRPAARLAEFSQIIRDVAQSESLAVADCFAAFEAVHARDASAWNLLLSDDIHPNMAGHRLFAETIAQTITGQKTSLAGVGPPEPALRHTRARLAEGRPIHVLAMPPYDTLITSAIRHAFPQAVVQVTPWPTQGQTLAQIRAFAGKVRAMAPDLVLIAIPGAVPVGKMEAFHANYSWTMNLALSFGPQQWDVIVAVPSATDAPLPAEQMAHEKLARQLIQAQDLHMIDRREGDRSTTADLLTHWLAPHLRSTTR